MIASVHMSHDLWSHACLQTTCSAMINMTYFHHTILQYSNYLPRLFLNVDSVLVLWLSWGFGDLGPPVEYSRVFILALMQVCAHDHRPQQEQNSAYWPVPDGKRTCNTGWMEILWESSLHPCLTRPEYSCRHQVTF